MNDPMTTTDPKLIERIARAIHDAADNAFSDFGYMRDMRIAQAQAALSAMPPKLIEPVAWMYVNKDGECEQIEYGSNNPGDECFQPLFTAAAINEAVQNERAGIVAWLRDRPSPHHGETEEFALAYAFAIERGAHLPSPPAIEAHKESGHDDDN